MSRHTRRVSRPLFIVLMLCVVAGAISIIHRLNRPAADAAIPVSSEQNLPALPPVPTTEPTLSDAPPTTLPANPLIDPADHFVAAQAADLLSPTTEPADVALSTPSLLADAQAKSAAGKLLDARSQLNDALQQGNLDETQAASIRAAMSQINQTVVFGRQHFADDPYGGTYVVQPRDSLQKIALAHDTTWELLSRINGIDAKHLRAGATIKVIEGPFFAVVDKSKFTMDIYLGGLPGEKSSMYVTTFPVGLGRDDSTPVGTWMIEPHHKLKHPTYYSPRGEGVIAADDPENPLGGYWIGLTGTDGQALGKLSYGIHGTIDPDSIGKQSSMGCIRLRADDIAVVFDLLVEGKSMVVVKS